MIELGELEKHHADFSQRNTRVVAASLDGPEQAKQTQAAHPHLVIVSDPQRKLAHAADLIHVHSAPDGGDSAAPTTVLLDRQGQVRWLFRPSNVIARLSPADVLAAVDKHFQ